MLRQQKKIICGIALLTAVLFGFSQIPLTALAQVNPVSLEGLSLPKTSSPFAPTQPSTGTTQTGSTVTTQTTSPTTAATSKQQAPATSNEGKGIIDMVQSSLAWPVMVGINAVLYVINTILSTAVTLAGSILNTAYDFNINTSPADLKVVQVGWAVVRDISNSLFILVLLWISFTIIFNLENLGGRKLFIRILMVALVINFSLVMVTAVFGLSNAFAKVFADQIQTNDPAGLMMNIFKVQSNVNDLTADEQKQWTAAMEKNDNSDYKPPAGQSSGSSGTGTATPSPNSAYNWGLKDTLLASVGIQPAKAQWAGAAVGCGAGAVLGGPIGCVIGGASGALAQVLAQKATNNFGASSQAAIRLALSNAFLFMTIIVFLIGALVLFARAVMMIILSIFAPLALLTFVVPSGSLRHYWTDWVKSLFNWALFAPGFYFLFYLNLFILQQYNNSKASEYIMLSAINVDRIIQVIIAIFLMFAAVKLARKTGGAMADFAMGAMQKGGAVAAGWMTGRIATGAGALARRYSPQIEKGVSAIGEVRGLRTLAAPITRKAQEFTEEQRNIFEKTQAKYKGKGLDYIVQDIKRSPLAETKVAATLAALEQPGGAKKLSDNGVDLSSILKMADAKKYNVEKAINPILRARPDLVKKNYVQGATSDRDALEKFVSRMKADDVANMDWGGVITSGNHGQMVNLLLTKGGNPERVAKLSEAMFKLDRQKRQQVSNSLQQFVNTQIQGLEQTDKILYESYVKYFASQQGKHLGGVNVPSHILDAYALLRAQQRQQRRTPPPTQNPPAQPPTNPPNQPNP